MKRVMKKVHIIFSYVVTFFMLLSLSNFLVVRFFKYFLNKFYLSHLNFINLLLSIVTVFFSICIVIKYYTPHTNYLYHDDIY